MRRLFSMRRLFVIFCSLMGLSAMTWSVVTEGAMPTTGLASAGVTTAVPAALPLLTAAVHAGTEAAGEAAHCALGEGGLEVVREHLYYQRTARAVDVLDALLASDCLDTEEARDLARFQSAYLAFTNEQFLRVVELLDAMESDTPVDDYVAWLRGQALDALGRHREAVTDFQAIREERSSPLIHQARVREAQSLFWAEDYEAALPVLDEVLETFPDYPRRHLALYYRAMSLEALGDREAAGRAHQLSALEFPYRWTGVESQQRTEVLRAEGVPVEPISPEDRYEAYRRLSMEKFWDIAHESLLKLQAEVETEEGNSELENKILERLALNAFSAHRVEDSLRYFEEARRRFDSGHQAGFNERLLFRNYSFALGRERRYEEALEVMEAYHASSPRRTRLTELGNFYERYGMYEDALEIYDQLYSNGQKRQWHYSYLLYKTGRLEQAEENLGRLANQSRGELKAQYLYWLGRVQERAGDIEAAQMTFADVGAQNSRSYYGIQARSRLLDMGQRLGDEGLLARQLVEALDAFEQSREPVPQFEPQADLRTMPLLALGEEEKGVLELDEGFERFQDRFCDDVGQCQARQLGVPIVDFASKNGISLNRSEQAEIDRGEMRAGEEAVVPTPGVRYSTEARIYWDGRYESPISFASYDRGEMIGPVPTRWTAYLDESYRGGVDRMINEAGELFPGIHRVKWLYMANWNTMARKEIRHLALEFRGLASRSRAGQTPHELPHRRWEYFIDNRRRRSQADFWGMRSSENRYPVPTDPGARQAYLRRQQEIFDRRRELRPLFIDAMQEVGDYHLVRREALADSSWSQEAPGGEAGRRWSMAYPRAFPEKVIPLARQHNINPYLIWALMLTESSFNPDSISVANAKGLLQVIPRTGLKIAELFGSADFGPFDLLEEDHSIEQGIFYFSRLVEKFHGQELLAFAGYNGGPHRVSIWLDYRGYQLPHDEFIEEIPFTQSREYAKKVLRFLHTYLQIYEGYGDELYIGQNLRLDYLEQPDF